ncbi:type VII secretion-associated protein [Mycobacterium sp.]|uniref:type VII secretion-associated protein n=1 Tax=Mycobacterium sp. TaxID=1785 RepID=UPI0025D405A6|nr:type VII secretion-associated protein [Mycobacterium sp.]MBW0012922.1 type VII secretion-associated protein [Mycobacterium sp.]
MRSAPAAHRAIIETGPATIRRLCCDATEVADDDDASEVGEEALNAIDDRVALVGGRPVGVGSLWCAALRRLMCTAPEAHKAALLVHPSWWSQTRVGVVIAAARTLTDDVLTRPRSWLLMQATDAEPDSAAVVEVSERLVVITGAEVAAIPRGAAADPVAEKVAAIVAGMGAAVVVIDGSTTIAGGPQLAALIAQAVRGVGAEVMPVGDFRLSRLVGSLLAPPEKRPEPRIDAGARRRRPGRRTLSGLAAAIVLAAAAPALVPVRRDVAPSRVPIQSVPGKFLVEGRVALTVPADWPAQRVVTGPGSARVQVTSPVDPEVALHVTQSPVVGETLSHTAERLKRAIDAEPVGVFVDFNPSGSSAGRPAVTYREVRAGHQVRWTILLDGPVRISVGCQSRPGDENAVHDACEQAVRSAHAIG